MLEHPPLSPLARIFAIPRGVRGGALAGPARRHAAYAAAAAAAGPRTEEDQPQRADACAGLRDGGGEVSTDGTRENTSQDAGHDASERHEELPDHPATHTKLLV